MLFSVIFGFQYLLTNSNSIKSINFFKVYNIFIGNTKNTSFWTIFFSNKFILKKRREYIIIYQVRKCWYKCSQDHVSKTYASALMKGTWVFPLAPLIPYVMPVFALPYAGQKRKFFQACLNGQCKCGTDPSR